ncbi:MAG: hypothetical protein NTU58_01245 [Candidatus Nealsonbacteria bacterium]|nr:hypothetical protein [Candidatus Nealsonbacteria bacterium]
MSPLKDENTDKSQKLKAEDYCVEFRILAKIYEYTEIKKKPIWFSRLVYCFRGKIFRNEISKAEDRLYHWGIIDKKYKDAEGLWTCCYLIEDEAVDFARMLYEKINL